MRPGPAAAHKPTRVGGSFRLARSRCHLKNTKLSSASRRSVSAACVQRRLTSLATRTKSKQPISYSKLAWRTKATQFKEPSLNRSRRNNRPRLSPRKPSSRLQKTQKPHNFKQMKVESSSPSNKTLIWERIKTMTETISNRHPREAMVTVVQIRVAMEALRCFESSSINE